MIKLKTEFIKDHNHKLPTQVAGCYAASTKSATTLRVATAYATKCYEYSYENKNSYGLFSLDKDDTECYVFISVGLQYTKSSLTVFTACESPKKQKYSRIL